ALVCYSKRALAVSNNSAQFMISPVYSSLQKGDRNSGYYDLVVKKEKTVPIKVKIANLNNRQKLTFLVKVEKDRKSTRLNSSHVSISYAVFCLKKKNKKEINKYTVE